MKQKQKTGWESSIWVQLLLHSKTWKQYKLKLSVISVCTSVVKSFQLRRQASYQLFWRRAFRALSNSDLTLIKHNKHGCRTTNTAVVYLIVWIVNMISALFGGVTFDTPTMRMDVCQCNCTYPSSTSVIIIVYTLNKARNNLWGSILLLIIDIA